MRKIQVLGIDLKDYTVRESMRKIDEFFHSGRMCTVAYITTQGLMEAKDTPEIREWMQALDLTVAADVDILHAAGVDNRNRQKEVEEDDFTEEFLKKVYRSRKSVFVLADTKKQLEQLIPALLDYQDNLKIVGTYALEELQADEDYVINEINIAAPNVVISILPSPKREQFFKDNHMKLNADLWLMLKEGVTIVGKHKGVGVRIYKQLIKKVFQHRVMNFEKETKE